MKTRARKMRKGEGEAGGGAWKDGGSCSPSGRITAYNTPLESYNLWLSGNILCGAPRRELAELCTREAASG